MLWRRIRIFGARTLLIGQTQSIIDKKVIGSKKMRWTIQELKSVYSDMSNNILRSRLNKLLDWAVNNNIFKETETENPIFHILGRNQKSLISIYGNGGGYLRTKKEIYSGGNSERNELINDLKESNLMSIDFDPELPKDGKEFTKKLSDLNEDEFEKFLHILSKYCLHD